MKFDSQKHQRTSTRFNGYDYSLAGAYFVTLVTYQREMLFGKIENAEMHLNRRGEIVREEWFRSAEIRGEIRLFPEEFIVMPNHIHGIVRIVDEIAEEVDGHPNARAGNRVEEIDHVGANGRSVVGATGQSPLHGQSPLRSNRPHGPARKSLSSFIVGFKSSVTKRIRVELNETGIWQRNYHDRIVRNDHELDNIRKYIEMNPMNWLKDDENPQIHPK